jgi:phage terminase large subunit-like protein
MTPIRPLEPDEIAQLTAEELAQLQDDLEALYWAKGKGAFAEFCRRIEVPGAPMDEPEPDSYYGERLKPAAHHDVIIDAVQNLVDGTWHDVDGVIVLAPPGSAKSTYTSVCAPAWIMGRKPGTNVIAASYGQELANRFGRRVRSVVRTPEFERIMGSTITGDNQAVDNWSLTNGSDYRAAGTGAAVTGFRADFGLLDDPLKGREEADSQVIRDKVWSWLVDDFFTRLKPGAKIFIILTHWHQDDPAGRILGEEWKGQSGLWRGTDGRLWHVVNLPMIAEHKDDPLGRKPGEMLWPEWYRESEVKRLQEQAAKGGTMSRTWSSLYQQRPAPADGSILLKSYWREWKKEEPPECDLTILTYDTAFEEDELNDPSAMTHWGTFRATSKKSTGEEYEHNHAILLGAWQDHVDSADLADLIENHYRILKPDLILVEKRASGATVISELKRRRLPVKPWLPRGKPGAKGKVPRAHGVAMMLESGSVWRFKGAAIDKAIDQCAMFPNGKFDDLVDCCTMALSWLRDRFAFQSAYDEPDTQEVIDLMNARFDARKNRPPRRGYGYTGDPQRLAQNERKDDDALVRNMTEGTRKRLLYGGNL